MLLFGCEKAEETITPLLNELKAEQAAKKAGDKDERYKTDKSGQYVSKEVQLPDYGGKERPTRPKYDQVEGTMTAFGPGDPCTGCDILDPGEGNYPPDPCYGCGGSGGGVTSNFVSSVGVGYGYYFAHNPTNAIQDLKIIKGSSASINPSLAGYHKINADLNRGAGGQYIYLTFTRDPGQVRGSSNWVTDQSYGGYVPVKNIIVMSYTIGGLNGWPTLCSPPIEVKDAFGFHTPDLNDGAGGKYIYAYQEKCDMYTSYPGTIKEVGVLYGNSSSISPPTGWVKLPQDLNEGAGGDYIYFCIKK
ncbi:hypothetical protein FVR03_00615 [Pontibacter qinzhouensis]|uniref:MABP domain-containing protein n=1 Tax=Pontibacter qinzhouensis TaxID=2603253 RepID=A0A5C8KFF8_9BACT|nr:hypothetical protein [Pontibacter qinzhouensis]TXK52909.1 hypothetical protein FVR03_00615 [Pontibacter qinzhouensis]